MKFVPIRLRIIRPSLRRDFDIYTLEKTKPILLLSKDTPFKDDNFVLRYSPDFIAYVPVGQLKHYKRYIANNIDDILSDSGMSQKNKMYAIYVSLLDNLEELVNNNNISLAKNVFKDVSKFTAYVLNDTISISIFIPFIKNNVYNLSIHMFNVGVYGSMMTRKLYTNLSNKKLEEVTRGYFLHDIGMLKIDKRILQKKGRYTQEEYEEVKKHPVYGVEILKDELKLHSPLMEKILLEHHERKDGSGYPYGKKDVNPFASICAMCDVFDAITSKREYKSQVPKTTFDALKDNKNFFIKEFGKEMYEAFVTCFEVPRTHERHS